jgi:glycine/D-amino acid oxidase-like deaminating enzyme
MKEQPHILVIGAGIIGASIAWHLVRDGARVTILDSGPGGGLATRHSWAWINASWGNPEPYFRLRRHAMQEWRRLERAVPEIAVNWSGGLLWDLPPEKLEAYAKEHAGWGYGIRVVDRAEAQRIEPQLAEPPASAIHVAEEGAIEPLTAAEALLRAAIGRGAEFLPHREVSALDLVGGRIAGVLTEAGRIAADRIVLAAGAATDRLAVSAGIALPMSAPAGLLVVTKPLKPILNGLVMAPELHVRQRADGCLIAGSDFGGADPGTQPQAVAERILAAMRALLKDGDALAFDHYTLGYRPLPADDFPAIGFTRAHDNLYLAVTHSGITLAPAIGAMASAELLHGHRNELLAPYGPARFGV